MNANLPMADALFGIFGLRRVGVRYVRQVQTPDGRTWLEVADDRDGPWREYDFAAEWVEAQPARLALEEP